MKQKRFELSSFKLYSSFYLLVGVAIQAFTNILMIIPTLYMEVVQFFCLSNVIIGIVIACDHVQDLAERGSLKPYIPLIFYIPAVVINAWVFVSNFIIRLNTASEVLLFLCSGLLFSGTFFNTVSKKSYILSASILGAISILLIICYGFIGKGVPGALIDGGATVFAGIVIFSIILIIIFIALLKGKIISLKSFFVGNNYANGMLYLFSAGLFGIAVMIGNPVISVFVFTVSFITINATIYFIKNIKTPVFYWIFSIIILFVLAII